MFILKYLYILFIFQKNQINKLIFKTIFQLNLTNTIKYQKNNLPLKKIYIFKLKKKIIFFSFFS